MKTTKISAQNLHLVLDIQKLQEETTAGHERIHREANEACQALHERHKNLATLLFKRLAQAEGLGDIDVGDYTLEVTYLPEHGLAFLKDGQRTQEFEYEGAETIPVNITAPHTKH